MAWNSDPKVRDCAELARKWGCDRLVVLGLHDGPGTFCVVTYGSTAAKCASAGEVGEELHRMVGSGELEVDGG